MTYPATSHQPSQTSSTPSDPATTATGEEPRGLFPTVSPALQDIQAHYDWLSRFYDLSDWSHEAFRYRRLRPIVWSHATAKTLDLGVGTGLNMPYYPKDSEVVGVDLSAGMLRRAQRRAAKLGVSVDLRQMDATRLAFPDGTFDSVVSTFLFCVLPNELQSRTLAEVRRVLKPDGRLILMEFVYSKQPLRRFLMKVTSPYVRWLYRAGFDRRTAEFLQEGGWQLEVDRFLWKDVIRFMVARRS